MSDAIVSGTSLGDEPRWALALVGDDVLPWNPHLRQKGFFSFTEVSFSFGC
jgi:hypothetical protein